MKLTNILNEIKINSPGKFETLRQYIYDYFKCSSQFEDGDETETSLRNAKTWDDIVDAIDGYWVWNDEQTVGLLSGIIIDLYLAGKTKYECDND